MAMKNPPQPGLSVKHDCLEPLGLTVTKGAKVLGVSRKALSDLGERPCRDFSGDGDPAG